MTELDLRLIAIRVPRVWRDRAKQQARTRNLTLNEYLWKLVEADRTELEQ